MLTLAAVADTKKINLDTVDVRIGYTIETNKTWSTRFDVSLDLGNSRTPRERAILFNSARWCEVSKLLSGENTFTYKLVNGALATHAKG